MDDESANVRAIAIELARASGFGVARGRIVLPTARLVALARHALAPAKAVESLDAVLGDGDVRVELSLRMMGDVTRVVVRASVASLHLARGGGALRLRLLEAPTIARRCRGGNAGVLAVLGAFGEAAFTSLGPEGIVSTLAQLLGPPLSARRDLLTIDLGAIPAVQRLVTRPTPLGVLGDLVQVRGARFRPEGLELAVTTRPRAALAALRARAFGEALRGVR